MLFIRNSIGPKKYFVSFLFLLNIENRRLWAPSKENKINKQGILKSYFFKILIYKLTIIMKHTIIFCFVFQNFSFKFYFIKQIPFFNSSVHIVEFFTLKKTKNSHEKWLSRWQEKMGNR